MNIPKGVDVIAGLKTANPQALQTIHHLFHPALCRFALGLLEDQPAAEDIVMEVFVTLWKKHRDFGTLANVKSFLYISTRNSCLNYLKKVKRDADMREGLTRYLSADYEEFALNDMIRTEVIRQIYEAIESLPWQCKRVFKLSYLYGKSNPEIASACRISVHTVKNHKVRALNLLRSSFSQA